MSPKLPEEFAKEILAIGPNEHHIATAIRDRDFEMMTAVNEAIGGTSND